MKLALPLFAALLVMGLLLFAIGDRESEYRTVLAVDERRPEPALRIQTEIAEAAPRRIPLALERAPSRSDAAQAVTPQDLFASGEVVVIEPDGSLNRHLNGELRISFRGQLDKWRRHSGHLVVGSVTVKDGQWQIRTSLNENNSFYSTDLETQAFRLESTDTQIDPGRLREPFLFADCPNETEGPGRLELVDDEHCFSFGDKRVEIVLRRRGLFRIEVNASDTTLPLEEVTIFKVRRTMRSSWPPEQRWRVVADAQPSPIVVDAGFSRNLPGHSPYARKLANGQYFVGSPGYAWQVVDLSFTGGETHAVSLERGGDLGVTLRGIKPPRNALLRVRSPGQANSLVEIPVRKARSFGLSGLPLGEQLLTIEVDNKNGSPTVLAEATTHILSGGPTQTVLEVRASRGSELSQVAGTLTIPPEWNLDNFILKLARLSDHPDSIPSYYRLRSSSLDELESSPGTYPFDFGLVHTGRYVLKVSPPGHGLLFDLGNFDQTNLRFDLPPPVDITVRLRDTASGDIAQTSTLVWSSGETGSQDGRSLTIAKRAPREDQFQLRVPTGEVTFHSATNRYTFPRQTVQAFEGASYVLDLQPSFAARLQLLDGETPVPWPAGAAIAVERLKGSGQLNHSGPRGDELYLSVTDAGRYRVSFPALQGFERPAPIEVKFFAGSEREVEVQLVRSR